ILAQDAAQLVRDALRQKDGNACSHPQKLHVRNGPQPAEQIIQSLIAEQERIASAQQHISHRGRAPDIFYLFVEFWNEIISACVADQTRTSAVSAIAGAPIRDQKQNA